MAFKIGFSAGDPDRGSVNVFPAAVEEPPAPRRSVVQVFFPGEDKSPAYYNDRFDLHRGDRVYVEGSMAGVCGIVTAVNYCFKIRIADYRRVIAVVDTDVHGQFLMAGSHLVTFEPDVLPREKAAAWYMAPEAEQEEFVSGSDGSSFSLDALQGMNVRPEIAERGHTYYVENRVKYLCVDGTRGYAIVEGSEFYEVEFEYEDGEISNLVCSCFCSDACKHEFAAMLQLQETMDWMKLHSIDEFDDGGYFAAILKVDFFTFAVEGKNTGMLTV